MTQAEARRIVWRRLMHTALTDIEIGEWVFDESKLEADHRRLKLASKQVAKTIERRHLREKAAPR